MAEQRDSEDTGDDTIHDEEDRHDPPNTATNTERSAMVKRPLTP